MLGLERKSRLARLFILFSSKTLHISITDFYRIVSQPVGVRCLTASAEGQEALAIPTVIKKDTSSEDLLPINVQDKPGHSTQPGASSPGAKGLLNQPEAARETFGKRFSSGSSFDSSGRVGLAGGAAPLLKEARPPLEHQTSLPSSTSSQQALHRKVNGKARFLSNSGVNGQQGCLWQQLGNLNDDGLDSEPQAEVAPGGVEEDPGPLPLPRHPYKVIEGHPYGHQHQYPPYGFTKVSLDPEGLMDEASSGLKWSSRRTQSLRTKRDIYSPLHLLHAQRNSSRDHPHQGHLHQGQHHQNPFRPPLRHPHHHYQPLQGIARRNQPHSRSSGEVGLSQEGSLEIEVPELGSIGGSSRVQHQVRLRHHLHHQHQHSPYFPNLYSLGARSQSVDAMQVSSVCNDQVDPNKWDDGVLPAQHRPLLLEDKAPPEAPEAGGSTSAVAAQQAAAPASKVHFSSDKDDISLYGTPKEEIVPGSACSVGTDSVGGRTFSFSSDSKPGWVKNQLQNIFQPTDNKLAMKLFGSKKALVQERVRQKAAGHWIIHPCSSFR